MEVLVLGGKEVVVFGATKEPIRSEDGLLVIPQKNDVPQKIPEQPPAPVFFLSFFDAEQPAVQNTAARQSRTAIKLLNFFIFVYPSSEIEPCGGIRVGGHTPVAARREADRSDLRTVRYAGALNCWEKNLFINNLSHFSICSRLYTPSNARHAMNMSLSGEAPKRWK